MSSDNPPYPYYNGIPFNPSFFTSDTGTGSGLTESTANTLYLRKPVPDTASALETFNGGIITPSVSSTGALNIIVPNALATDVLNVGVVSRNISGQVHHYSDGDNCVAGAGVHINNGANNASNTNIMNGNNTSGTLNLMTGTGTNAVNIGNSNTTLTSVGVLRLNNTGSATTNIGDTGLTTLNGANVNINTLNGTDTTIGKNGSGTTSLNNPTVNLGRVGSSTTTVRGLQVNISGTTNDITGITNINGVGSTNGQLITIGNATAGTTTLNSNTLNIGNINTVSTIEGYYVNIQNLSSSVFNLATQASLGSLVNILTGANNTGTFSLGNTGTTSQINGVVNINTTVPTDNLTTTTIGATSASFDTNTTMSGKTTINKLATPLIPVYDYPITTTGSIGALITAVNISPLSYSSGAKTMSTLSLTKGLWIITSYAVTGAFVSNGFSIYNINTAQNTTATGTTLSSNDQSVSATHTSKNTLTFTYSTNASIDIYFNYSSSLSANLTSLSFKAIRMA